MQFPVAFIEANGIDVRRRASAEKMPGGLGDFSAAVPTTGSWAYESRILRSSLSGSSTIRE
jgi:hypothetical protein